MQVYRRFLYNSKWQKSIKISTSQRSLVLNLSNNKLLIVKDALWYPAAYPDPDDDLFLILTLKLTLVLWWHWLWSNFDPDPDPYYAYYG